MSSEPGEGLVPEDVIQQGSQKESLADKVKRRFSRYSGRQKLGALVALGGVGAAAAFGGIVIDRAVNSGKGVESGVVEPYPRLAVGADRTKIISLAERDLTLANGILARPIDGSILRGGERVVQATNVIDNVSGTMLSTVVNAEPDSPDNGNQADITIITGRGATGGTGIQNSSQVAVLFRPGESELSPSDISHLLRPEYASHLSKGVPIPGGNNKSIGTFYEVDDNGNADVNTIAVEAYKNGTVQLDFFAENQSFDPTPPPLPSSVSDRAQIAAFLAGDNSYGSTSPEYQAIAMTVPPDVLDHTEVSPNLASVPVPDSLTRDGF